MFHTFSSRLARAVVSGALALVGLLGVAPADAHTVLIGDSIIWGGSVGGGYTQPTLTSPYLIAYGDSRTANGGGATITTVGSTYTCGSSLNNQGYAGWLAPLSSNAYANSCGYNYGIGAQTTAGILGRLNTTGIDCNDTSNTTSVCFTGTYGTGSSWNIGTYTFSFAYTAGAAMTSYTCPGSTCPYVQLSGQNLYCQASSITGTGPYTVTIPSTCGWMMGNGTVVMALSSQMSNFHSYLGASMAGASITDPDNSKSTGYGYSPLTDPAQVVFFLGGTNDGQMTFNSTPGAWNGTSWSNQQQTIANYQTLFTQFGPSGANKILIVGDEVPAGLAQSYSSGAATNNGDPEVHTIPASATSCGTLTSAYCFTITKSGAWFDTQQAWFSPCGTGTGAATDHACGTGGSTQFAAAANDGLKLTYCNAACWTAAGNALPANSGSTHYFGDHATSSTIPAGVYDFNAADAGLMAAVHYRWIGTTRTLAEAANHDWLAASASSGNPCAAAGNTFVGALSGYTLPTPAANCPTAYPWVHVAQTWEAVVDPTAVDTTNNGIHDYPLPYTNFDGLHPLPWGGASVAKAMIAAVPSGALPAQTFAPPTATQGGILMTAATATNSAGASFTSSTCTTGNYPSLTTELTATGPYKNYTLSAVTPAVSTNLYQIGGSLFVGSTNYGFPQNGAKIVCLDTANDYIVLDHAATSGGSAMTSPMISNDAANILPWGVISYAYGSTASGNLTCANCLSAAQMSTLLGTTVEQMVPNGWGSLGLATGVATAIGNGSIGYGYGIEQNPFGDGYDDFVQVFEGYNTNTSSSYARFFFNLPAGNVSAMTAGQTYRASCEVMMSAGPNGHLTGVSGVNVVLSSTVNSAYQWAAPGYSLSTYVNWAGSGGFGATGANPPQDQSVASGAPAVTNGRMTLNIVSGPVVIKANAGTTSFNVSLTVQTNIAPYDPVSAVVRIRRCKVFPSSY